MPSPAAPSLAVGRCPGAGTSPGWVGKFRTSVTGQGWSGIDRANLRPRRRVLAQAARSLPSGGPTQFKRYGGREIDTAGDGFFIAFEAPGRALRCARMIVETLADLDLEVRIGAHIGEVHVDGRHVTGGAVHIASRVMAIATPGEVLVSRALRDVVAGSDIELADRGIHQLKGVPGEFQLYAASSHSFYLTWIRNGAPCELLHDLQLP